LCDLQSVKHAPRVNFAQIREIRIPLASLSE
jgi:hypothetical protein